MASVALAKRMERCGADAVVAEGCEAGGHIGETYNDGAGSAGRGCGASIPVIAAGGIARRQRNRRRLYAGSKRCSDGNYILWLQMESQVHENYKASTSSKRRILIPG